LKKAMELYPVNSSIPGTPFARKDPQPSISEACQTLMTELTPPIQTVTETITEDITADEPSQTMAANEMRCVKYHVYLVSRDTVMDTNLNLPGNRKTTIQLLYNELLGCR
jgi:hypothetical protein